MQSTANTSPKRKKSLTIGLSILAGVFVLCACFGLVLAAMAIVDFGRGPVKTKNVASTTETGRVQVDDLSFYEQELIGTWSRYHSYDGSSDYVRFNPDRTACKWIEPANSNARTKESSFVRWDIDEDNPVRDGCFRVVMTWSNGNQHEFLFDYPAHEVWPEGADNLKHSPSSSGKICD